uniref:Ef-hand calcium-binding domain-containing protein 2 n=1 Tax=Tetraselmis sp. GSL018 TaxID=582737 RepID=A0A061RCU6_9CHLO
MSVTARQAQAAELETARRRAREAFLIFEHREGSKLVDVKEIPTVIRSLGINPTSEQCEMLVNDVRNEDGSPLVAVEKFESIMGQALVDTRTELRRDDYHRLLRAFRAFDPEKKGWINADFLKNLMLTRAEQFTADEVNHMLSVSVDEDTGKIFYEDYAMLLATDGRDI